MTDPDRKPEYTTITTVGELCAALARFPAGLPVRLALAPGYPQAATVGAVACSPDDADLTGRDPASMERVVWISEGTPLGYLPEIARDSLGDRWS